MIRLQRRKFIVNLKGVYELTRGKENTSGYSDISSKEETKEGFHDNRIYKKLKSINGQQA